MYFLICPDSPAAFFPLEEKNHTPDTLHIQLLISQPVNYTVKLSGGQPSFFAQAYDYGLIKTPFNCKSILKFILLLLCQQK